MSEDKKIKVSKTATLNNSVQNRRPGLEQFNESYSGNIRTFDVQSAMPAPKNPNKGSGGNGGGNSNQGGS